MNNLELEIRMVKVIRNAVSILLIISAVACFIGHYNRLSAFDIVYSVFMSGAGIVFLLGNFGTEKILIKAEEASIFIKWVGEIRGKQVLFNDIDRIYLKKAEIEIGRTGMKRLKYNLDNLDRGQKKEVYDLFIKAAAEKNLILERHF